MITIIPAIDIIDGKCVRLTQGDYSTEIVYNSNPLDIAKQFEYNGFKRLHLVDLDGAKNKGIVNIKVLEEIASKTNLEIDFGGGIKSLNDLNKVFQSGAKYATLGSYAALKKEIVKDWINIFSPEKFIIGIDILNGKVKVKGWKENASISINEMIRFYKNLEIQKFMITDISKDGKLQGLNISFYKKLKTNFPEVEIIASGGVSSIKDIKELEMSNIDGIVVGKAIYENKIDLKQLKK